MDVPLWVWLVTVAAILAAFAVDLLLVDRRPHEIGVAEAARWVVVYIASAVAFGVGVWVVSGAHHGKQFFAGYLTEYSLSVDNLFVFLVIVAAFGIPRRHEHKVVLFGVLSALVLRGVFIAAGAAIISRFEWIFYVFGAFLIATAVRLGVHKDERTAEYRENAAIRRLRKIVPVTPDFHGGAAVARVSGKWQVTPIFVVMVALGTTDVLFAFDSIPAIFGLTKEPYIVFTANAFALMGLRQLYFMVGGLLTKLVYLNLGLAVVLGFIGVKLICEALADSGVSWAPHIGIELSLGIIAGIVLLTTAASLVRVRADPSAARRIAALSR